MNNDFEFPEAEPAPKATRTRKSAPEVEAPKEAVEDTVNLLEGGTPEFDETELEAIFDTMMFESNYTEEVTIGRRFKVTFQTRTGKDARFVMEKLDKSGYAMGLTVESIRSLYNIAQSAVVVNGQDISGESFDKKIEMIEELPTPVIAAMINALVKFDRKVEAAVRHGEENF